VELSCARNRDSTDLFRIKASSFEKGGFNDESHMQIKSTMHMIWLFSTHRYNYHILRQ
jgi:hypothetical protein